MSSKISRKTTQQSSSTSTTSYSTPQDQSSAHMRSRSPLSPTRVSRFEEKCQLQDLNNRLATYMDTVRSLEKENTQLMKQVEFSQESIETEKRELSRMYDNELADARQLLDSVSKDKVQLEIENKRLREENEDLKSGLDKSYRDCRKLEQSLSVTDTRLADLQTKLNKSLADLKNRDEEVRELDKLRKNCESLKNSLDQETLQRVNVENKLMTLKETANFKQQVLEENIKKLTIKRSQEISEIDGRLTVEYEDKLQSALMELRKQYEAAQDVLRDEITSMYDSKLRRLEEHNSKNLSQSQEAAVELREYISRYTAAENQRTALKAANDSLTARVQDLEKQLENERNRGVQRLAACEHELAALREEMNVHLREYQDLMEIKVALDSELSAYRKLLEFEESRLKINVAESRSRRGTPQRRGGTPLLPGKASKRRRINMDSTADAFQVTGESITDIAISDVDPDGKFIQLHNKGDKEMVIGGWTIKHVIGEGGSDKETVFKLHRSVKIEAGGNVTVHSADAGQAHEPPHNIVMKQKWFSGDTAVTTLINSDAKEVARRERQRVQSSSYQEYEDETDNADPQKQECLIM